MTRPWRSRLNSLIASSASSALTWWLTAPWVTHSSSAARVKLSCRAAASKAFNAFSGGRRGRIANLPKDHEKNWGKPEKPCFASRALRALLRRTWTRNHEIWSCSMSTLFNDGISLPRIRAGRAAGGHQESSWLKLIERWLAYAERMQQRADLREIANDPHLLAD